MYEKTCNLYQKSDKMNQTFFCNKIKWYFIQTFFDIIYYKECAYSFNQRIEKKKKNRNKYTKHTKKKSVDTQKR